MLSNSCTFRHPHKRLPDFLDPDPDFTQQLALECKRWSCASETFLLSTCEIEPRKRRKYLGRASEAAFQLKPMVERIPPAEEHGRVCGTGMSVLVPFVFPSEHPVNTEQAREGDSQRAEIIRNLSQFCDHSWTILKNGARRRGLRERHHRLQLFTQGVSDPAIVVGDVKPFQKEARLARLGKGNDACKARGAVGPWRGVRQELMAS